MTLYIICYKLLNLFFEMSLMWQIMEGCKIIKLLTIVIIHKFAKLPSSQINTVLPNGHTNRTWDSCKTSQMPWFLYNSALEQFSNDCQSNYVIAIGLELSLVPVFLANYKQNQNQLQLVGMILRFFFFFCALGRLQAIARNSDWFFPLVAPVVISQSNNFGFVLFFRQAF